MFETVDSGGEDSRRFLSQEECRALADRVLDAATGGGETDVQMTSWWAGELRWARNRVALASDRRALSVTVRREMFGASSSVTTNQADERSLASAVRAAERLVRRRTTQATDMPDPTVHFEYASPLIWSDTTFNTSESVRGRTVEQIIAPVETAGMLSAGYVEVRAAGWGRISSSGLTLYAPFTTARCTMTVRDPEGTGSGWAGRSSYDWAAIDANVLGVRALEKCLSSRNPVMLEPGRYTVVLEPQAVCDLLAPLFDDGSRPLDRRNAEQGKGPFAASAGFSKLGQRVVNDRVTMRQDPSDPELGVRPFTDNGEPIRATTWIDRGVLTTLAYDRAYALSEVNENLGMPNGGGFRMEGGSDSIAEMITTTRRGVLITRFSNVSVIDPRSMMETGYTRDGLWLIENGAVLRPVKNFRFTESLLFVLNNIEQMGPSVPVFRPRAPAIVPSIKARDFNLGALADAV